MNALSWSIIMYAGPQYVVIMFSINASAIYSDLDCCMGTVIK